MQQGISELYYIRILEDGSFENVYEKSLYIQQGSTVRVILNMHPNQLEPVVLMKRTGPKSKGEKLDAILKDQLYGRRKIQLPMKVQKNQIRASFQAFAMHLDEQGDYYCELHFNRSGSQFFRLLFLQGDNLVKAGAPNYFLVQPKIALEGITMQTVLPYSLGEFNNWRQQLESQISIGYKAFHLPPIQRLGESGSLYAIENQKVLNPDIFKNVSYAQLTDLIKELNQKYGTLFFIDILCNHTSFDSDWLNEEQFKDAVYNEKNTPHLACAIELDNAIGNFSNILGRGEVDGYEGNEIKTEEQLERLMNILWNQHIAPLKLHEYFQFNIEQVIENIQKLLKQKLVETDAELEDDDSDDNIFVKNPRELLNELLLNSVINKGHGRFGTAVKYEEVAEFINSENHHRSISVSYIRTILNRIDQQSYQQADGYLREALSSTRGQIKWWKIECKQHLVVATEKGDSLVPRYFTKLKNGNWAANNGWIQDYDPLKNFAETDEHHYFRRSIIIWGDLIKLRFGLSKSDVPALWKHMREYVQQLAQIFHGVRLDNAHSTPAHVGEYLMRKARAVNEDLIIVAELFTGSPHKDSKFTKQLGLNALVREINRCFDANAVNGALHYHSGDGKWAVGSLPRLQELFAGKMYTLLRPESAPALLYEQSHDNETLISSHGVKHQLPIAALLSFAKCMKGTVRGYDQYLPERLSVVSERRLYHIPQGENVIQTQSETVLVCFRIDLSYKAQTVEVRGSFNGWSHGVSLTLVPLHTLGVYTYYERIPLKAGYHEYKFVVNGEWINPSDLHYNNNGNHYIDLKPVQVREYTSMESVRAILINNQEEVDRNYPYIHVENAGNSLVTIHRFSKDYNRSKVMLAQPEFSSHQNFLTVELPGMIEEINYIFLNEDNGAEFRANEQELLPSRLRLFEHRNIHEYASIYYNYNTRNHVLKFNIIPKSLVIILTCVQENQYKNNIAKLANFDFYSYKFSKLSPDDINMALYSSEAEERERIQEGLYYIPNYRQLIYGGYFGVFSPVRESCQFNNLAHPLHENLRQGNWLIDYLERRLNKLQSETSKQLREYVSMISGLLREIPRYLIPTFFSQFTFAICYLCQTSVIEKALPWMSQGPFFRQLSVASYQFIAQLPSAQFDGYKYSMSAGHPHFTTGWARAWGRDTFISFKGLLLLTGLIDVAREILYQFASTLRHGLLPNLLDSGNNPRYNNRDACWWFIKALKDYIEFTNDTAIWKQNIKMRFLDDDMDKHYQKLQAGETRTMSMQNIVQNILEKHANGIQFREWRAGPDIDRQMESDGFNIKLHMDPETGFIVGGNWRNCLTWMDKMGSSEKAKNKGYPATSRDGAPIEMTALLKCALDFLHKQNSLKVYEYDGVKMQNNRKLTFKQWSDFIAQNFERYYWVPRSPDQFQEHNVIEKYVRHRQIYRDLSKSSKPRSDYQLRCNACIAIAVAPDLFNPQHAKLHLATTEATLIEPKSLGIKTLDPNSTEFCPYYDNSDDSIEFKIAHGFSYHNGPEWVWVYGFYLKALNQVYKMDKNIFYAYLANHKNYIATNEWYSLPEMTNANGEYNVYSCRAQAWSIATILEAIDDYQNKK